MRNIINNQKKERDMLLAMPYITRQTKYDEQSLLSSKQIKLITGPRRSGKSTEALMLLKNRNFAYLNFDDGKLLKAWDEDLVSETLRHQDMNFFYSTRFRTCRAGTSGCQSYIAKASTW